MQEKIATAAEILLDLAEKNYIKILIDVDKFTITYTSPEATNFTKIFMQVFEEEDV